MQDLSRRYLFINPAKSVPVFEYRGSLYIAPGCDIDGFNAELVCVTSADASKYKDIKCSGSSDCACYSSSSIKSYSLSVSSAGKMTQGVPLDKAFHKVLDSSIYVYDHLKVELLFSDAKKKKACLPDSNQDGIFYYPFTDRTALNLIGCEIVPSGGEVSCVSGISKELGFGNLQITSVEFNNDPNINVAIIGDTFKAYPVLTKTGSETMCLYSSVYKGEGETKTKIQGHDSSRTTEQAYSSSKFVEGIAVFKDGIVPQNLLGSSATLAKIDPTIDDSTEDDQCKKAGVTVSHFTQYDSKAGSITIHFLDDNGDGVINCGVQGSTDKYSLSGTNSNDYGDFPADCVIKNSQDVKIGITKVTLDKNYCKDIKRVTGTFTISNSNINSQSDSFTLELVGGLPVNGVCSGASTFSTQKFTKTFTVSYPPSTNISCNSGNGVCKTDDGRTECVKDASCSSSQCCVDKSTGTTPTEKATKEAETGFGSIYIGDPSTSNLLTLNDYSGTQAFGVDVGKSYDLLIKKADLAKVKSIEYGINVPDGVTVIKEGVSTSLPVGYTDYYLIKQLGKNLMESGKMYSVTVTITNTDDSKTELKKSIYALPKCGPDGSTYVCMSSCGDGYEAQSFWDKGGTETTGTKCTSDSTPNCCKKTS